MNGELSITTKAPERDEDYQKRFSDGSPLRSPVGTPRPHDVCSELNASEITGLELSDEEGGGAFPPSKAGGLTPVKNPLQYLQNPSSWSPGSGGGNGAASPSPPPDEDATATERAATPSVALGSETVPLTQHDAALATQIAALRAEHDKQATELAHRLEKVERISRPLNEDEAREDHLEYMRKWMERLVNSVCAAHPTAEHVSVLLEDFQSRLRQALPKGETAAEDNSVCRTEKKCSNNNKSTNQQKEPPFLLRCWCWSLNPNHFSPPVHRFPRSCRPSVPPHEEAIRQHCRTNPGRRAAAVVCPRESGQVSSFRPFFVLVFPHPIRGGKKEKKPSTTQKKYSNNNNTKILHSSIFIYFLLLSSSLSVWSFFSFFEQFRSTYSTTTTTTTSNCTNNNKERPPPPCPERKAEG